MKYKTNELTDKLLDAAVAKALGWAPYPDAKFKGWLVNGTLMPVGEWEPSSNWYDGGQIIERERIGVLPATRDVMADRNYRRRTGSHFMPEDDGWVAGFKPITHIEFDWSGVDASGPTALIAAMRVFVRARIGDEVDL